MGRGVLTTPLVVLNHSNDQTTEGCKVASGRSLSAWTEELRLESQKSYVKATVGRKR